MLRTEAVRLEPVEKEEGTGLFSMIENYKHNQRYVVTAASKMVGNILAGNDMFDGFALSNNSPFDIWLYKTCLDNRLYEGIEFTTSSKALGKFFNTLLNINFSGTMRKYGTKMNHCYSSIRSTLIKNG